MLLFLLVFYSYSFIPLLYLHNFIFFAYNVCDKVQPVNTQTNKPRWIVPAVNSASFSIHIGVFVYLEADRPIVSL